MNSLIYSLSAAGFTSLSSLCFRKTVDIKERESNPKAYLVPFYFISFVLSFILLRCWESKINLYVLVLGGFVGLLNSALMLLTSKALATGPAGLTYAFQNAAAVFPGLLLFILLGSDFGFSCSLLQVGGIGLVLFGLFLGTKGESQQSPISSKWLIFAILGFAMQMAALTCIQGRCVLFDCPEGFLGKISISEADDIWFMPGLFGVAFIIQSIAVLFEKKKLYANEALYGVFGGIANFSSTWLLLLATKVALPFEKGILFPFFAVSSLILCNLWANRLYGEKFNFKTNLLCSCGIFMAIADI